MVMLVTHDEPLWRSRIAEAIVRVNSAGLRLRATTSIRVHDEVHTFVRATNLTSSKMRGWATYDQVELLHPRHWDDGTEAAVRARLTHELAHAATFQNLGKPLHASAARLPPWAREGIASVIAAQGPSRPALHAVVRAANGQNLLKARPTGNPALAYAAGHHAIALLARRGYPPAMLVEACGAAARNGVGPEGCMPRVLAHLGTTTDALWADLVAEAAR